MLFRNAIRVWQRSRHASFHTGCSPNALRVRLLSISRRKYSFAKYIIRVALHFSPAPTTGMSCTGMFLTLCSWQNCKPFGCFVFGPQGNLRKFSRKHGADHLPTLIDKAQRKYHVDDAFLWRRFKIKDSHGCSSKYARFVVRTST